jgi:4-coumarate--CoA ligase
MVSVLEMVAKIYPKLTLGVDAMLGILPFYHIYGMHLLDSAS